MKDRKLWETRLKKMKNYEKSHKEAEDFGSKLPDSRYEAIIQGALLKDSNKGKPQMVVSCKVVDDEEFSDVVQPVFMGLSDTAEKADGTAPLVFTLNTLKRLGFELTGEDPTEIIDAVEELNGSKMRIKLSIKDGYGRIDGPSEDGGGEESSEEDSGDKSSEEEEESTEKESAEGGEVTEGAKVTWESNGEEKEGTVIEVLEDDNIARIEKEDGKISRVPIDKLTVTGDQNDGAEKSEEEEEEEVEEKPKKSVTKKKKSRR
jgi:hypothetical protein